MYYNECKIYKLSRKKDLYYLLNIDDKNILLKDVNKHIRPRIDKDLNMKPKRLIESFDNKIKPINKILYNHLANIKTPEWHLSKKGSSYIDNAIYHKDSNYILLLDISKFFPNTPRESVYKFYINKLLTSSDISNILTDITTVNLERCIIEDKTKHDIEKFLENKKIWQKNHLMSGASTSCILSFLVHYEMFKEIKSELNKNEKMSVYVDDITISSYKPIDYITKLARIKKILLKYNHRLSHKKVRYIDKKKYKKVTGVMISTNNNIKVPNNKHYEIVRLFGELKETGYSDVDKLKRLIGLVNYARSIEKNAYPRIYQAIH